MIRSQAPELGVRVGVYIDAFNVYYGGKDQCGRGTERWRWLDLEALSRSLLDLRLWPEAELERVVYCTAYRDRAGDPHSIVDQQTYIGALKQAATPTTIVFGQYVPRVKSGQLVNKKGKRVRCPGVTAIPPSLPSPRPSDRRVERY